MVVVEATVEDGATVVIEEATLVTGTDDSADDPSTHTTGNPGVTPTGAANTRGAPYTGTPTTNTPTNTPQRRANDQELGLGITVEN